MIAADKIPAAGLAWLDPARLWADVVEDAIDAAQRSVLFWPSPQRGNQHEVQQKQPATNALSFRCGIVMDGRTEGTAARCFHLFRLDPDTVGSRTAPRPERLRPSGHG